MIKAFLFDAEGEDREIDPPADKLPALEEHHLLWVDIVGRDDGEIARLQGVFDLQRQSVADLKHEGKSPAPHSYGEYFQCEVIALAEQDAGSAPKAPEMVRLDFIVGPNWLVTVADVELSFLREFRDQDRGESMIGGLSSASLAAALSRRPRGSGSVCR
jgi:Mg2+ and Co2+ transporter CorA